MFFDWLGCFCPEKVKNGNKNLIDKSREKRDTRESCNPYTFVLIRDLFISANKENECF